MISEFCCETDNDYCQHNCFEEYFVEGETNFKRCPTCDLVFRNPFPSASELHRIYDDLYVEQNIKAGKTNQETNPYTVDVYADYLVKHIIKRSQRVLDFGAGSGALVQALRKRGVNCDGFEISMGAREFSEKKRGIILLPDLEIASQNSYDVVLMIEVIEHLSEPWKDLLSIRGMLTDSGRIFVTTPNRESLRAYKEKGYWREATKRFHLILFNFLSLRRVLIFSGFKNVKKVRFSPIQKYGINSFLLGRFLQAMGGYGTLCVVATLTKRGMNHSGAIHFLLNIARAYKYFISPISFLARRFVYRSNKDGLLYGELNVCADLGSGVAPYKSEIIKRLGIRDYVSLDISPSDNTDVIADARFIPLQKSCLDILVSFDVLQHISNVALVLDEASRVIRPGGYVLFTFPFLYAECDVCDYYRWTKEGMEDELRRRGFEIIRSEKRGGYLFAVLCMIQWAIQHIIPGGRSSWRTQRSWIMALRYILVSLLTLPVIVISWLALMLDYLLPESGYYMGGIVLARKSGTLV